MPRRDRLPAREEPGTPATCTGNGGYGGGPKRTAVSSKEFPDENQRGKRNFSRGNKDFFLGLKESFIDPLRKLKKRFAP